MPPTQDPDASDGASASDSPATAQRKVMSSNLMNMKFMQRGRDAEIATKLQEQYKKEVSDQQWHLSTVREVDVVKQRAPKIVVAYEPSYSAFEINTKHSQTESQNTNAGRKTFGGFVPDIDELLKEAQGAQTEEATNPTIIIHENAKNFLSKKHFVASKRSRDQEVRKLKRAKRKEEEDQ